MLNAATYAEIFSEDRFIATGRDAAMPQRLTAVRSSSPTVAECPRCADCRNLAESQAQVEEMLALLLVTVEMLVRHTRCPAPAPWRPQTMRDLLT